ncbi:hypothetical protein [Thermohalobaculum sediminis]|nr:hypothetical protein [Limibaculum sediminis]
MRFVISVMRLLRSSLKVLKPLRNSAAAAFASAGAEDVSSMVSLIV